MLRANFERDLRKLQDRILALGSQVEENIVAAAEVLLKGDAIRAQRLIAGDVDINNRRITIMVDALTLIATQQPMGRDMRLIASVIEIVGELERINDYVKGIARISLMIEVSPLPPVMDGWTTMAGKTREMLHQALEAASAGDADLATRVPLADDEIDELFKMIYKQIMDYARNNPDQFELINYLEWALHNLERAADRVTNICEWVVYHVRGVYVEMDSEIEAPPSLKAK